MPGWMLRRDDDLLVKTMVVPPHDAGLALVLCTVPEVDHHLDGVWSSRLSKDSVVHTIFISDVVVGRQSSSSSSE